MQFQPEIICKQITNVHIVACNMALLVIINHMAILGGYDKGLHTFR